jgi:hypothetical protein
LLGTLALVGVIVNDSLVMVVHLNYLMGVQAIDQNIFPEVMGKTKVFD